MFKTSTSTFQVTDHAALYANRTIGEDWIRHIYVRQRQTPDDSRLLFIVKKLPDMRAQTVCSKFTEVLTEFGMPTTIMADFGRNILAKSSRRNAVA